MGRLVDSGTKSVGLLNLILKRKLDVLSATMGNLSVAANDSTTTDAQQPQSGMHTLSFAVPAIPVPMHSKELPKDPAALAERLQHQKFTEQALDMVGLT